MFGLHCTLYERVFALKFITSATLSCKKVSNLQNVLDTTARTWFILNTICLCQMCSFVVDFVLWEVKMKWRLGVVCLKFVILHSGMEEPVPLPTDGIPPFWIALTLEKNIQCKMSRRKCSFRKTFELFIGLFNIKLECKHVVQNWEQVPFEFLQKLFQVPFWRNQIYKFLHFQRNQNPNLEEPLEEPKRRIGGTIWL